MVSDTRSTLRARNVADDKNSKKKAINGRDTGSGASGKANVASLTRSGRETPVSAQSTPQGIRKSKRLENEAASSSSSLLKRSERLEKHKSPSPSPLSNSDKGARALPSSSIGRRHPAKELSFSEEKTNKEMKRKNVMEVLLESEKTELPEEVVKKRKKITGAYYKSKYINKQQTQVPDIEVDETPGRDGVPDSQAGHSPRETLFDHRRLTANSSSAMNADSLDSESSSSLPKLQDGTTHFENGDKCTVSKDISGVMDGCERLSLEATAVGVSIHQPPGGDSINDSLTSLTVNIPTNSSPIKKMDSLQKETSTCMGILQEISESGEKPIHPEAPGMTPFPNTEDINLSGNCLLCSKRKRIGACSAENDLCSCGGTERGGVGQNSSCKDGGNFEPATASKPVDNCYSGERLKESCDNVIANCSKSGEILCSLAVKNSKRSLYAIADGGASRFLEYWVPVQISFYQLEQYCEALLSNSIHLCSCEKKDTNGALRETLVTNVRKCCDHPFLLDMSFQKRLIKEELRQDPEVVDFGIKASAKLEVLDMMLTEIKSRGSQVLILLQLLASPETTNVAILDDFLRKRFGQHSFEWIDGSAPMSKKQATVDRFNKKENGVFVLLLEKGSCSSAIKLLSLDNIIIYGSDWNVSNDLKTLQKLSFDSKLVQVKVFRLYSSYTIEERSLILGKRNVDVDFALFMQTSRAIADNLLMWGASHLFSRLNDFHVKYSSPLNVSSQHSFLSELLEEFRSILGGNYGNGDGTSLISRANKLDAGGYMTNVPLLGEREITMKEGEEPRLFWKNALELKSPPHWKLLRVPSSRNRKRVESDTDNGGVGNKRRKAGIENNDLAAVQVEQNEHQEAQVADAEKASNLKLNQTSRVSECKDLESIDRTVLAVDHNSFLNSLLAEVKKLCDVLKYSENVTNTAIKFLEYFTKNFRINSDSPPAIVQAFQISLCWIAASDSKVKVDKGRSLLMSKHHLNYQCSEENTRYVYQKMRTVLNAYLAEQNGESSNGDGGVVQPKEIGEKFDEHVEIRGGGNGIDIGIVKLQKKCSKRQKKLRRKQSKEMQEFHQIWDDKKNVLRKDFELELAFVRTLYEEGPTRKENLHQLEDKYAEDVKEHDLLRDVELKKLEAKHLAEVNEEQERVDKWLKEAKACSSEPAIGNGVPKIKNLVTSDCQCEVGATEIDRSSMDVVEQPSQTKSSCDTREPACMEPPTSEEHPANLTSESPMVVPEASTGETDPNENVLLNTMEALLASENLAAEPQSQDELVEQNQPRSHLEFPEVEPSKAVTDVQANSELQEDEPEEGEILGKELLTMENHEEPEEENIHEGEPEGEIVEKESPAMDNQSTVQGTDSLSAAIVDTVGNTEGNVGVLEIQDVSEAHIETSEPVDSATNAPNSKPNDSPTNALTSKPVDSQTNAPTYVEPQERVPPAVENESTFDVVNSHVVDAVDPVQPILEQAHTDAPVIQTQISRPECPVSEAANTAIPLQLSVEIPVIVNSEQIDRASPSCNQPEDDHLRSDQRINSSQTADVVETVILPHSSISQTEENSDLRTGIHGQTIDLLTSERSVAISQSGIGANEISLAQQSGINASHYSRTAHPVHPVTHQAHPWTPQTLLVNPIRNEVDRLNKEKCNLEKNYADMVARLQSDCDREIQEITIQIKHNYAKKLQESEAEYAQRKTVFEKNLEQACMNLKLAENFSEKCLDRPPGNPGFQQGTSSGSHVQQMQRSSVQARLPASASSFPPSPGHPIANPVQPSPSHANPVQPFTSHLNASHIGQRAMPRDTMRPSPVSGHSVMAPPLQQSLQRATAPSRPPVINTLTPRNPRINAEIRCQAPHLQSFRPHGPPMAPATTLSSISQYQPVLPSSQPSASPLSLNEHASSNVAEDLVCLSDDD